VIEAEFAGLAENAPPASGGMNIVPRMPRLPPDYRFIADDPAFRPEERRVLRPSEAALDAEDTQRRDGDIHAQLIGSMYHEAMRKLAQDRPERWKEFISTRKQAMAAGFRHLGLPEPQVAGAVERVSTLLRQTMQGETGHWLLAPRSWARNEYALAGYRDGRWVSAIIDRCFQDENGVFWVIDYKTTAQAVLASERDNYLAEASLRYRPQLENYVSLLKESTGGEVRAALYFPDPDVLRAL
jgi:ATP-dependent exoDNAse (exonuclease V) beta subunit